MNPTSMTVSNHHHSFIQHFRNHHSCNIRQNKTMYFSFSKNHAILYSRWFRIFPNHLLNINVSLISRLLKVTCGCPHNVAVGSVFIAVNQCLTEFGTKQLEWLRRLTSEVTLPLIGLSPHLCLHVSHSKHITVRGDAFYHTLHGKQLRFSSSKHTFVAYTMTLLQYMYKTQNLPIRNKTFTLYKNWINVCIIIRYFTLNATSNWQTYNLIVHNMQYSNIPYKWQTNYTI